MNVPPLMNMPLSQGVHHSSWTLYSNWRLSLAIRTDTIPGETEPRCSIPIPVRLISRVIAEIVFPRCVLISAGTDNSSRSLARRFVQSGLPMLSSTRRRSSIVGRLKGSCMSGSGCDGWPRPGTPTATENDEQLPDSMSRFFVGPLRPGSPSRARPTVLPIVRLTQIFSLRRKQQVRNYHTAQQHKPGPGSDAARGTSP